MRALLLHGLGRSPLSMALLGHHLRQAGHLPESFGYLPLAESYDGIQVRLVARARVLDARGEPWVAIGHSLGGLLLRDTIATARPVALQHLIMLGTPNRLPRLAPRASACWLFRWLAGDCGRKLADPDYFATLAMPDVPITIIAGTRGPRSRWSPFGDAPNDGVVALDETRLRPDDPIDTFPVLHTFMMNDRAVRALVLARMAAAGA